MVVVSQNKIVRPALSITPECFITVRCFVDVGRTVRVRKYLSDDGSYGLGIVNQQDSHTGSALRTWLAAFAADTLEEPIENGNPCRVTPTPIHAIAVFAVAPARIMRADFTVAKRFPTLRTG